MSMSVRCKNLSNTASFARYVDCCTTLRAQRLISVWAANRKVRHSCIEHFVLLWYGGVVRFLYTFACHQAGNFVMYLVRM
jgi:hypothetical protein